MPIGLFSGAGEAPGDLSGSRARRFVGAVPLHQGSLSHVRKVKVVVELGGGPDLASFKASTIRRDMLHKIRLASLPEE